MRRFSVDRPRCRVPRGAANHDRRAWSQVGISTRWRHDPAATAPSAPAGQLSADIGAAERFHTFLRLGDERRWWGFDPVAGRAAAPLPQLSSALGPPALNNRRVFQVCATVDCSRFNRVVARARAVKSQVAIYVDSLAPGGGLDSTSLDSIARVFSNRLYPTDTAAFGRESDIDSNTVVMVLMTNTVNKLVSKTTCQNSGFVAGFFYGLDLDPHYRTDSRSNKGEVFYSIVPDPAGVLSCSHTTADVEVVRAGHVHSRISAHDQL